MTKNRPEGRFFCCFAGGSLVGCVPEGQHHLRGEVGGIAALGRPLQVNAAHLPRGRETVLPRIVEKQPCRGRQSFVRPVVVEAESWRGGQQLHALPLALRGDRHAEGHLLRPLDVGFHQIHTVGEIRAVEPHPLHGGAPQELCPLRHAGRGKGSAVDGLPGGEDLLHLRRLRVGAFLKPLNIAVQLVAQPLQPPDHLRQVEGVVQIVPHVAQRQPQALQNADGSKLHKGVDGVVTVSLRPLLRVRTDQPELLIVEDGAAGDAQRFCHLSDGKQIVVFFHKKFPVT